MNFKALLQTGPLLLLAGCATNYSPAVGYLDEEDFGEANRQTYAAMIVDPDPEYDEPLDHSGEMAADAIERYRKGDVKEPQDTGIGGGLGSGS